MAGFMSGSAWSMAKEIADGYVSVSEHSFKRMTPLEMNQLGHEIERALRELRGGATANEETTEVQVRQRRIQRLTQAITMMRAFRQKFRK